MELGTYIDGYEAFLLAMLRPSLGAGLQGQPHPRLSLGLLTDYQWELDHGLNGGSPRHQGLRAQALVAVHFGG